MPSRLLLPLLLHLLLLSRNPLHAVVSPPPAVVCPSPLVQVNGTCFCKDDSKRGEIFQSGRLLASPRSSSTCIISSGAVKCWGDNSYYQFGYQGKRAVGTGAGDMSSLPALNVPGSAVKAVAGEGFLCVLNDAGEMYCSGSNALGQAGAGNVNWTASMTRVSLGSGRKATDVTAGAWHACAVLDNGQVKCWGLHTQEYPCCGVGSYPPSNWTEAMRRMGDSLPYVPLQEQVQSIAAGDLHTCALLVGGDVQCWGDNSVGQLGSNVASPMGYDVEASYVGMPGVRYGVRIWAGGFSTCVELDTSEVFCFGLNRDGLLGYQDTTNRWLAATPAPEYMEGIQDIAIGGRYFACFQLVDMTVKCIGNNGKGQLGTGKAGSSGTSFLSNQTAVLGGMRVMKVVAGYEHACALLMNESVVCWGSNTYGELGIEQAVASHAPSMALVGDKPDLYQYVTCTTSEYCLLPKLGNGTYSVSGDSVLAGTTVMASCLWNFVFQGNLSSPYVHMACINKGVGHNATWDAVPPACIEQKRTVAQECSSAIGAMQSDGTCLLYLNPSCSTWRSYTSKDKTSNQAIMLAQCMQEDCAQGLMIPSNTSMTGCRYVDSNGLCLPSAAAQAYCLKDSHSIFCKDAGPSWAMTPLGNATHQPTSWYPKYDVAYKGTTTLYSCACMQSCTCTRVKSKGTYKTSCTCYNMIDLPSGSVSRVNYDPIGRGLLTVDSLTKVSTASYKGKCSCTCADQYGF